MKSRRFQPTGIDALEDRLVLTAFVVPFSLVTPPASQVNPKFLNLTGRTEGQINSGISNAFNTFTTNIFNAYSTYDKASAKPGADATALLNKFDASIAKSFTQLSTALSNISYKLPFGHVNLNPVLQHRIIGSTGVTDTTTMINTPSLQTQLTNLPGTATNSDIKAVIRSTQSLVTSDVNNYINLGVTNSYFRVTRGAIVPALS